MRELTAEELDRLVRSNRRLMISMWVTLGVIVAVVAILVANDLDFAIRGGAGLGVLIGLVLLIPNRRVLKELDLTSAEARVILGIEKDRRSGLSALPPLERARRESVRARNCVIAGLVLLVTAVIELPYFFSQAGEVHVEGAPTDPAFVASIFLGWGGLIAGLIFLMISSGYRHGATTWRLQAEVEAAAGIDSDSDRGATS